MDHVELKPYPMPEGVTIPRLMPYQEYPWNGDGYLAAEVLRLKAAHGLKCAIETGTCLGSTALWINEHFAHLWTVEVHRPYFDIAVQHMAQVVGRHMEQDIGTRDVWIGGHGQPGDPNSIKAIHGDSAQEITKHARAIKWHEEQGHGLLFWLDAHWQDKCPLLEEMDAIAKAGVKPCIVVHDFLVPHREAEMGYDKMPDGKPFCYNLIEPYLIAIYGEEGFTTNYPTSVEGACRGWISIEPISAPETQETAPQ